VWDRTVRNQGTARIKKVSVVLYGLVAAKDLQADLFDGPSGADRERRLKAERVSRALDKLNHRYGRDTVLPGLLPSQGRSFSGTRIAFTRIPDREEFLE
jgi:DNA polymerase-4